MLVVEHDEDAIRSADYVVDMGLGAGVHGGEVIAQGTLKDILRSKESLTAQYLNGTRKIALPKKRSAPDPERQFVIEGASGNNLKNVTLELPVGLLTCVTGVSGSGKSTLVNDTLYLAAARHLYGSNAEPAAHEAISGFEHFDKVITVDQAPIGRTPRSNPATYTGVFTPIRDLFSTVPVAKERGYQRRPLLVQRQGRALRSLPGRRRDQGRDAFPAGRLRAVRRLPRQALQPRNAGSAIQGQEHHRSAGDDGRGSGTSSSSRCR